jgi:hypothetical protein
LPKFLNVVERKKSPYPQTSDLLRLGPGAGGAEGQPGARFGMERMLAPATWVELYRPEIRLNG